MTKSMLNSRLEPELRPEAGPSPMPGLRHRLGPRPWPRPEPGLRPKPRPEPLGFCQLETLYSIYQYHTDIYTRNINITLISTHSISILH